MCEALHPHGDSVLPSFLQLKSLMDSPICGEKLLPSDLLLLHSYPLASHKLPPLSHKAVTSLPCLGQPLPKISLASLGMVYALCHPKKSLCLQSC